MRTIGLTTVLIILASLLLAAGCNKQASSSAKPSTAAKSPQHEAAEQVSLFAGTKLLDTVPLDLDVTRKGDAVVVQFLPRETDSYQIAELTIADGAVTPKSQLYSSPLQNRAFVRMHPLGQEALVLDNAQEAPGKPVVDTVWRAINNQREEVRYLNLIPNREALSPDACYALEPFFTWDGHHIVIPLKESGVCIVSNYGRDADFYAYPPVDFEVIGLLGQPLPDQDGRRIAITRWELGNPDEEKSRVDVLNLDTGEWEASITALWPIYEIAAKDIVNGPWLLSGSRSPQDSTETKRVPRLMRADPASGALDLVEFQGQPYWNVRLDPTGEFVVYMDQQRKALVRLKLATGEMDIDPAWFEKEAEVLACPGADPVFAWKANILHQAKWTQHEQVGALEGW